MTDVVVLNSSNAREHLRGLPRWTRLGLTMLLSLRYGSLLVHLPDGQAFMLKGAEPGPDAILHVHDWRFAGMVVKGGNVGVGEAYMLGYWSSPDVTGFLELFCINRDATFEALHGRPLMRALLSVRHWLNMNTKRGSKRNISAHYDLGNAFYKEWLDPSMTYSSAIFDDKTTDLEAAQALKYASLVRETQIGPNDKVLEIGCGWGGFAEFVGKEVGAHIRGLTISREQYDFARERIFKAGLNEKVEICFQDYRDERGTYDRIASIEMFEAVGERYWPTYFKQLSNCLKPGGRAGLQIITIQDRMFDDYRRSADFIQRHIFPGGMLPPPSKLTEIGKSLGLDLKDQKIFGQDYARTLAEWRTRFWDAWPRIRPLGFDERFKRLWEFYLHYCEAGFRAGNIDVRQMVYVKNT
ncbi:cyclopropane-fatty-acyl-phospholipid synthase [Roseibium hamelinense]|uniref:Cyclopropane-fatty-acyl-phospholipid synthase n=1 Tax=Roseibium hamelinense TaxID=150831 RepID=A0A562THM4_9HYPH|nr:cyclopropane-fatty-acyl-phospholipid synthase family protein [Roseibium hamelinense]MTI46054.1 class I SAM-dependent methyltransferase [Roseibium hamelinense]TWI92754.1 cyclopropane-fatty-acyl-phospholipid synthase [Roseibium hamelinense]